MTREEERREQLLTLRDVFELEYQTIAMRLQPALQWISKREWPGEDEPPNWVKQFEHMSTTEAEAHVQVRVMAHAVAETILKATRPDLDEPPPISPLGQEPI